jgi:L-aspartate oxidase
MANGSAARFPTVQALCAAAGFDPAREPIPVAPAAHYHMGGIAADDHGRTSLDGLWVCGEVAATGVHGANRLASNSLLEGLVFGHRVADDIASHPVTRPAVPNPSIPTVPGPAAKAEIASLTAQLRELMYEKVGLRRDGDGLRAALSAHADLARQITTIEHQAGQSMPSLAAPSLDEVRRWGELHNLALAGHLVTLAASRRCESRGAHYRADYPQPAPTAERQFLTIEDLGELAPPAEIQGGHGHGASAAALSA